MAVINQLAATHRLLAKLMYGAGLRIGEVIFLQVKNIDVGMNHLVVRNGKGNRDRTTVLPGSCLERLQQQTR
jgi:integrase